MEAELPATGFAIGLERWALCALGEEGLPAILEEAIKPQAVFIPLGDLARRKGLGIVQTLRNSGFKIEAFFEERSLKALLREADKRGVKFALILGENELKEGKILVKDLHKGMQKLVEENQLLEILKES